jgi:predicted metal-binding membrane protein
MFIMPAMQNWTAWHLILVFLMWAIMMVAMMVTDGEPDYFAFS